MDYLGVDLEIDVHLHTDIDMHYLDCSEHSGVNSFSMYSYHFYLHVPFW